VIFRKAKDVIGMLGLNAVLLLPEGKEPRGSVRVNCIEGGEERARAVPKKTGRTNKSGSVVPEEAARRVAWNENVMPGGGKVWQRYTPVGMFLIDVGLITELIWTVRGFCEVPLVELTFMFIRDLRI
jgi:hypothetical protein